MLAVGAICRKRHAVYWKENRSGGEDVFARSIDEEMAAAGGESWKSALLPEGEIFCRIVRGDGGADREADKLEFFVSLGGAFGYVFAWKMEVRGEENEICFVLHRSDLRANVEFVSVIDLKMLYRAKYSLSAPGETHFPFWSPAGAKAPFVGDIINTGGGS